MNARGTINATRLEPETGRLQYFLERANGISDWQYANDPKFITEFGDLVKKFISEPIHHEERRRRAPQQDQQVSQSPKSTSSSTSVAVKGAKNAETLTSSETGSVTGSHVRLPVGQFRQARIRAPSKLARVNKQNFVEDEDVGTRYSLKDFGLLAPSRKTVPEKRASPVPVESSAKIARKAPASSAAVPSSKPHTPNKAVKTRAVTVQDIMRRKIMLARNQQIQRDQQRQLLSGFIRSAQSKLQPVSINISPSRHRSRTSVLPLPRRTQIPATAPPPRENGYTNSPRSATHFHYQQQEAAIASFLSQPVDNYSSAEEASTSTSTISNSGGHYFSIRRGPKRQAASGQMSQLRYSQIVLRHRPGWTQLWLFTTTRMQNAINPQVCEELSAAIKACIADNDTSLILISSSGPTFSSGIDLQYLLDAKDPSAAGHLLSQSITELCNVMLSCPKPIFVAVNGLCVGIGVALCCMADVVIATEKAVFSTPYAQLGHVPEGGLSTTLQNTIGRALASDMLMAGRRLTAVDALRAGLVSRILWPTNFVQELIVRLDVVASNCSPALEATKFLMRTATNSGNDTVIPASSDKANVDRLPMSAAILRAIQAESELLELFWTAPESQAAMRRYVENI